MDVGQGLERQSVFVLGVKFLDVAGQLPVKILSRSLALQHNEGGERVEPPAVPIILTDKFLDNDLKGGQAVEFQAGARREVPENSRDDDIERAVDRESLSHRILPAEVFGRRRLGQDDGIRVGKCRPRVSLDERKGEHGEEIGIGVHVLPLGEALVAEADQPRRPPGPEPGGLKDLGEILLEGGGDRRRSQRARGVRLSGRFVAINPEDLPGIDMKPVEAEFVDDPEHDHHGDGQADGQAGDVDE